MSAAAFTAAIAASHQATAQKALVDQLVAAGATSARTAAPLDLSEKGAPQILAALIKYGHVREAGGEKYWVNREAIKAGEAKAGRIALIALAALISLGASLIAILATR